MAQCRPGSILAECHMWVEFVAGFSPGSPVFLFPEKKKKTFPNSKSTWIEDSHENQLRLTWLAL